MRVACVVGEFPVLAETPFLNQITGLIGRGHEVDIFADRPQAGVTFHPDIARLRLGERTRYPATLPPGGRWSAAARLVLAHAGEERRILLRTLNPLAFWSRAWSLEHLRRTASYLPRRRFDVCYCPFVQDTFKAWRLRRVGVLTGPLVAAVRGSDITRYVATRGPRVYARMFRRIALLLPVCEAFARRLIALGAPPERVVVHGTGIDLREWPFRPRHVRQGEPLRLATVGRLVEKKGIEYVLDAVRMLVEAGVDVQYDIAGDGPLRGTLAELRDRLGLGQRVRLLGWATPAQVRRVLDEAHLFVAASVRARDGDEEGIPNVLKEAMASGLPVVATRHGGIPELITDGESGYLVGERDAAALAERLGHLAAHPERWTALGAAGRSRVEREYDIERLNDRLVAMLTDLNHGAGQR
ncbi:MAG TPA: glycosyltransferase [Gemmatimonadales bacterium]